MKPADRERACADPLTVACGYCRAPAGTPCGVRGFGIWRARPAMRSHKNRAHAALVLAAHSDPALDLYFARTNPCGFCGWLPQRHRQVDSIAGMLAAGECDTDVAADMRVSLDAVMAVQDWANRWPGAWK